MSGVFEQWIAKYFWEIISIKWFLDPSNWWKCIIFGSFGWKIAIRYNVKSKCKKKKKMKKTQIYMDISHFPSFYLAHTQMLRSICERFGAFFFIITIVARLFGRPNQIKKKETKKETKKQWETEIQENKIGSRLRMSASVFIFSFVYMELCVHSFMRIAH